MVRIFIMIVIVFSCLQSKTQTTNSSQVAERIAGKMKDSLQLSDSAKARLYEVNMQLHSQKSAARQVFTDPGFLQTKLQEIENTRDSLYSLILPVEKYLLYKQKKVVLISYE